MSFGYEVRERTSNAFHILRRFSILIKLRVKKVRDTQSNVSQLNHTLLRSAPASIRITAACAWPESIARCNGVLPTSRRSFRSMIRLWHTVRRSKVSLTNSILCIESRFHSWSGGIEQKSNESYRSCGRRTVSEETPGRLSEAGITQKDERRTKEFDLLCLWHWSVENFQIIPVSRYIYTHVCPPWYQQLSYLRSL